MKYWAVDYHIVADQRIDGREVSVPKFSEQDKVIFFKRTSEGELRFAGTSFVASITLNDEKQIDRVSFDEIEAFETLRRLEDFAYSLKVVTNFKMPSRHFARTIRQLPKDDFDSLSMARIYWARSAFGIIANSLPTNRFLNFIQLVIQEHPKRLLGSPDFAVLWPLLNEWVQKEYFEPAYYSNAISTLAEKLVESGVKFSDLRIGIEETTKSGWLKQLNEDLHHFHESVKTQADSLPPKSDEQGPLLWDDVDYRIEEKQDTEFQFQKVFSKEPWPIIHKIGL